MHCRRFFRQLIVACALALGALSPLYGATPNVAVGVGHDVIVLPFHLSGQYTATTNGVVRLQLPFRAQVLGTSASARASGGTSPTLTVDVLEGGVTILSAPMSVTAGSVTEGTLTDTVLADEAIITVNLAIGGTSPTWNDITVLLTLVRY
jgi:hypothetical protein